MTHEQKTEKLQQPTYSEAVQKALDASRTQREALMTKMHLTGTEEWFSERYTKGPHAGPSGGKEMEYTLARFRNASESREKVLADEAQEKLLKKEESPQEVEKWLKERLDALQRGLATVLQVTAVRRSVADGQEQDLDEVEILQDLDSAVLFITTMHVEDFLLEQGQNGHLPKVLDALEKSRHGGQDLLQGDDYTYVIGLISPVEWPAQARAQVSAQQVAESVTFGLIWSDMTEVQHMTLLRELMKQKSDIAASVVVAMAEAGVLKPIQAKDLLENAPAGVQMPAADMGKYVETHMAEWSTDAQEVQELAKKYRDNLGERAEGTFRITSSWGKLGAGVVGMLGVLWAAINLFANRGRLNEFSIAGLMAAAAGAEVVSDGALGEAARRIATHPAEREKQAREIINNVITDHPHTMRFFVENFRKIENAIGNRRDAQPPQPAKVVLEELGSIDEQQKAQMVAEYEQESGNNAPFAAEQQLTAVWLLVTDRLGKKTQSDARELVQQQEKELGLSTSILR